MTKKTFHAEPYFDDFSKEKGFHKILFVPKGAVQARELNQMQTIINSQIEEFGDHVFKHGSIVTGTTPTYNDSVDYVRLNPHANGIPTDTLSITKLQARNLKGRTSGITAKVIHQVAKSDTDPDTIYVQYSKSGGEGGDIKKFLDGETIDVLDDFGQSYYTVEVRCPTCPDFPSTETIKPTGKGTVFNITTGVYYVFGYFVFVEEQLIVLSKYDTEPSYDVGFEIQQSIVTSNDDESLLDNALGYPNHTAKGADRYKIKLKLTKRPLNTESIDNWILVARINHGILNEINDKPEYGVIEDMIARRTHDESGDYTVSPFLISFKEMLKTSADSNDGLTFPTDDTTPQELKKLEDTFAGVFTQGKAYVQGREVERISNSFVEIDKARDFATVEATGMRTQQGNYFYMTLGTDVSGDVISSIFPLSNIAENTTSAVDFEKIELRNGVVNSGTPSGTIIGYARVKSQEKYPLPSGHAITDTVYKIHLFDIEFIGNNTFANVKGIYKSGVDKFFGHPILDSAIFTGSGVNVPKIYTPTPNNLLMELPYKFTKKVSNTELIIRKKFIGTTDASGVFTFGTNGDEYLQQFNSNRWLLGVKEDTLISYVPVALTSGNLTIITPQSAKVTGLLPNKQVVLTCDVRKVNVTAKEKTIEEKSLSFSMTIANQYDWIELAVTDAWKIVSIKDVTDVNNALDITSDFELDKAIFDNYYSISKIRRVPNTQAIGANINLEIVVQYLDHVGAGGGFFFSPNSYQTLIADPNNDFGYEDIPSFLGSDGVTYELRSCLDFRPDIARPNVIGDEFDDTTFIPARDTNIIFDIEFYLPRIDRIVINELGDFLVVKGVPSLSPQAPKLPTNTMNIYDIQLDAYTFNIKEDVSANYVDNRRFTMRDIGKIEKRVDNLEYYSSFNQLEKSTESLNIKDANGFDRFKNGFVTDNFTNFTATDTGHHEFECAVDTQNKELRPSFVSKNVNLVLDKDNSTNVKIHGDVITADYNETMYIDQPYASKSISVNPYYIFNWTGELKLSPDVDAWKDLSTKPDLVVNVNTGFNALRDLRRRFPTRRRVTTTSSTNLGWFGNNVRRFNTFRRPLTAFNTVWGSWRFNNGIRPTRSRGVRRAVVATNINSRASWWGTSRTRTDTIRTDRDVMTTRVQRQQRNLGDRITDVNIIPYIRASEVDFVATSMRPNTRVYAYFDEVDVSEYCRPINGRNGGSLITNDRGELLGKFAIPNNSRVRFKVGDRVFKLLDSNNFKADKDEVTTSAEAKYWAGGVSAEKQGTRLNVTRRTRTLRTVSTFNTVRRITFNPRVFPRRSSDPIAQDFIITEENGIFLTKISVFFEAKSKDKPVWLELRKMVNGYPAEEVLPYSHVVKQPANVKLSTDSKIATTFEFEAPVYLKGGENYCFVVGSDDLAYRLWVSRLGGRTIDGNILISTQPSMGSMFKSQNNRTWTAEQLEDVKFQLHQAQFDRQNDMVVKFKNGLYDSERLDEDPFETQAGSNLVRVYHQNHGLIANDKVKFDMYTDVTFPMTITSGDLIIGQKVTAVNGQGNAVIKNAVYVGEVTDNSGTHKKYNVLLKSLSGDFAPNTEFVSDDFIETVENNYILKRLDIDEGEIQQNASSLSSSIGKWDLGISASLNGIALARITEKEHIVQAVDSIDSYVIQLTGVESSAISTGRVGSTGVHAVGNIQVDAFEVTGQYDLHDSVMEWNGVGIHHSGVGSKFIGTDYHTADSIPFIDNELVELERPLKIANPTNELAKVVDVGKASMDITASFKAINYDINVTPILYDAGISMTTITNRCDWNSCENYSIAPNQTVDELPLICDESNPAYNARYISETNVDGGSEGAKYIVKKVTLSNPATSLRIYLDIYKTVDSDVMVYYKTLPVESSESIEDMAWVNAKFDNEITSEQADEFIEITSTIGDPDVGQSPLPDFKEFRVKIVMKAKNSSKPPKAKNFRAIAVT